jgi:co-chaperonin GroES (HSP10)
MYETDLDLSELAAKLPQPTGYKVLVAIAKASEKKGSIFIPEELKDRESTASIVGTVILIGSDAYADSKKFPSGPYCKIGDWITFRSYSGTRVKIGEQEFRFINDDQVESVLPDPLAIERV